MNKIVKFIIFFALLVVVVIAAVTYSKLSSLTYEGKKYNYNEFIKSEQKENFLKNSFNSAPFIKTIAKGQKCEKVSKFETLYEDNLILAIQLSCENIPYDFHVMLPKKFYLRSIFNSCKNIGINSKNPKQCKENLYIDSE